MEKYYGYYKCRMCGKKFIKCEIEGMDTVYERMWQLTNDEKPVLPKLFAMHFCKSSDDDEIGLADFIGLEKEKQNAKTND